ncbi:MAG: 15-cis-phytoene synthase [Pseudomonadota bacterium]
MQYDADFLHTRTTQSDLKACVAMMQSGSKTFFAASRLLPPRVRSHAIALYAFCRVADDLIDEQPAHLASQAVDQLRQRLDAIYRGVPGNHIEDQALSLVVEDVNLPRHFLDWLIEGFAWDAQGFSCVTLSDVHNYAVRVAGTVGAMMCWIMGQRDVPTLSRACELGVAMQLTNMARDVGDDARKGRIYLPLDWMHQEGIQAEAWLNCPEHSPAIGRLTNRLLDSADELYVQALPGIASLPTDCRAAIHAANLIYAEIGHQLRREGLDSVNHRTVVSTSRKLVLLLKAWTQARWICMSDEAPSTLPEIEAFLGTSLEPGARIAQGPNTQGFVRPQRSLGQRVNWVMDLIEKRETLRRERPFSGVG